jgi:hypothetical protein
MEGTVQLSATHATLIFMSSYKRFLMSLLPTTCTVANPFYCSSTVLYVFGERNALNGTLGTRYILTKNSHLGFWDVTGISMVLFVLHSNRDTVVKCYTRSLLLFCSNF